MVRRNRQPLRIGIELGDSSDRVSGTQSRRGARPPAFRDFFDDPGDFEPRNEWGFRRARIQPHALKEIGEIDADGAHANERFAGFRLGIGQLPKLQHFGRAIPPNHHDTHLNLLCRFLPGGS